MSDDDRIALIDRLRALRRRRSGSSSNATTANRRRSVRIFPRSPMLRVL